MPPSPPDTVIAAGATGAISGAASGSGQEETRRSRKPANTKFKQQQLPAWQPMLTARSVLPFLVAIGVAFIPIGIALYLSASNVTEIQIEYTNCRQFLPYNGGNHEEQTCANISATTRGSQVCKCREDFTIDKNIGGPVFMYYALDNFFQNHRKYVKSRDDNQLMGDFKTAPSADCSPFGMANSTHNYAPCGAIANSLFNDSIKLNFLDSGSEAAIPQATPVLLLGTNIAWYSDRTVKFQNPPGDLKKACEDNKLRRPAYWTKELWELENGLKNEDLIVWMRTAAFPSFRKLYRRVNHTGTFEAGLPAGNYSLDIDYNYPVTEFEGRKYVILSSVSWIGGRNPFLGIAYMTVGCACLLLAAVFFFIHIRWGKKPSDMMNVTAVNQCHEAGAFMGLTADRSFARATLSSVGSPSNSSRSRMSSSRWLDTNESPEESSESRSGRDLSFSAGNSDGKRKVEQFLHVVTSPRGPPLPRQNDDDLVQVTVLSARDPSVKSGKRSVTKGLRPDEVLTEQEIRHRQTMDQPVLVD